MRYRLVAALSAALCATACTSTRQPTGKAEPLPTAGQPCDPATELCAPGLTCQDWGSDTSTCTTTCSTTADCKGGDVCGDGYCVPRCTASTYLLQGVCID